MNKRLISAVLGAGALAVTALTAGVQSADAASTQLTHLSGLHPQRVCATTPKAGHATCFAQVLVNKKGAIPMASAPLASALTPVQLRAAYNLPSSGGGTVAIVDAYGYPNLERDLTIYRNYYNLPSCTSASGCLKVMDQNGGSSYPRTDTGWDQEQALDVDAVSAACPNCKIVVVEATSASFANLGAAVNTAARQSGVVAISNSYGGGDAADTTYGGYYNHPGIAVTASTGDNGYRGGSYPASSSYVTAVGGTTLKKASTSRGWNEAAWSGAGSGCSTYNKQTFQSSVNTGCGTYRAMADVSAAADPNYGGLSVYAPTNPKSSSWSQYGGTSESSPIIASVYALAGGGYSNATPYSHTSSLFDVVGGSNGTCSPTQLCTGVTGWDGPTGLGTPNGTGAF